MKAFLILEDGTVFTGTSIGSTKETISEIVFNTAMSGYLEVLTDPAAAGQAIVMTYPLIGNYGITPDGESKKAWADAIIVRELSRRASNFRCEGNLIDYLNEQNIPGICGIDTRAVTKLLREKGAMKCMITTDEKYDLDVAIDMLKTFKANNYVMEATEKEKRVVPGNGRKVALLDFGSKGNIVDSLNKRGCEVNIYPAFTSAEEIIADKPDGIVLSNGAGNPEECIEIINEIRKLSETEIPILGISFGHLLMALAKGGSTYKLKNGHRGGNYAVKDLATGRVYISSQNHGYAVDEKSFDTSIAVPAFVNVNDGTNEGMSYVNKKIMTVQFQLETGSGQKDLGYVYDEFMKMMGGEQ